MTRPTKVHEFQYEMSQTSGIFGRDSKVRVVFKGDEAHTNGDVITLPQMAPDVDLSIEMVMGMRGYVDHEAGHHRHSSIKDVIIPFYKECWETGHKSLKGLHNQLEDIWMEAKVMREYPGTKKNLTATMDMIGPKEVEAIAAQEEHYNSWNIDAANLAIACEGRKDYGGKSLEAKLEALNDKVKEHSVRWVEEVHKCTSSADVTVLSKSIYKLLKDDPKLESKPEDFDPLSGADFDLEGEEQQDNQKSLGEDTSESQGEGQGEGETQATMGALGKALKEALEDGLQSGAVGSNDGDLSSDYYSIATTESDHMYRVGKSLRGVGNQKTQDSLEHDGTLDYQKSKGNVTGSINTMKARLKRALMSIQRRDWEGGREVGRLDTRRLVSASQGSQTVFKRRVDRDEESTAITILVDLSGSMSGGKDEVAQESVIALVECFEGTNLNYQVVGFFNSSSRSRVSGSYHREDATNTLIFKEYGQPLRTAQKSLGNIKRCVQGCNSDRDYIVWCINQMSRREETRKVLLVLSDGSPAHDSSASTNELIKHTKSAVDYSSSKGVECIGIGIQDNSVSRIYKDNVVIGKVGDLSGALFTKFTNILMKGKR